MRIAENAAQGFGFASLVHELQGRVSSIAMLTKELKLDARRNDSSWLDGRMARIHRAAAEMQRIIHAVNQIENDCPLERLPIDVSGISARLVQGHFERTPDFGRAKIRFRPLMERRRAKEQHEAAVNEERMAWKALNEA